MNPFETSSKYFPTPLQETIYFDKYSRYRYDLGRRESWPETVDRVVQYLKELSEYKLNKSVYERIHKNILELKVMPSMRLVAMAGEAAHRNNIAIYNCSFMGIDNIACFAEALYISIAGCGVGFSVEKKYIEQLPKLPPRLEESYFIHTIQDSSEGWYEAIQHHIGHLYDGLISNFDYSKIRPAGAPLRIKGGRACLTSDTILYKERKTSQKNNTITIKELYQKRVKSLKKLRTLKLRSLEEELGIFYGNKVVDVIDNGIQDVYLITTESGYQIKSTKNHRFLSNNLLYKEISEFSVGDLIAVNGTEIVQECTDCKKHISKKATRCRDCFEKFRTKYDALPTTARRRKSISIFREKNSICERCKITNTRMEIHHIDENPFNNDWSNLLCLCSKCHQKHHAIERTFGNPYSHKYLSFDKLISIEYVGRERVYDLQMSKPNHNFVANGFVSHNSGSEILKETIDFITSVFKEAITNQQEQLKSIQVHDIMCSLGNCAVAGGVRRSAMISLFDNDDDEMLSCKNGTYSPYRWNANNTRVLPVGATKQDYNNVMESLFDGMTGEPGIYFKESDIVTTPPRRDYTKISGINPCGEIKLRSRQFCNLSSVICREEDTLQTLTKKVELATIIGTIQSMATDFPLLGSEWKNNCEEERLLGVDLNGQMDCPILNRNSTIRDYLKTVAIATNRQYIRVLGINESAAITCVNV